MDRLTTLIDRFSLTVTGQPPEHANLAVQTDPDGLACAIVFLPRGVGVPPHPGCNGFTAHVAFGGAANPILAPLPDVTRVALDSDLALGNLVAVMQDEISGNRCGAASVLNRLGEVLVVRLLRHLIETGVSQTGALGGLADPRLSRALVAIHDRPDRAWSPEDLAVEAGLSRSRFSELFLATVGESPAAYLRKWRLTLAHQDLSRGDRVDTIARRYGFGSADAFTRAFRRAYGQPPRAVRATTV